LDESLAFLSSSFKDAPQRGYRLPIGYSLPFNVLLVPPGKIFFTHFAPPPFLTFAPGVILRKDVPFYCKCALSLFLSKIKLLVRGRPVVFPLFLGTAAKVIALSPRYFPSSRLLLFDVFPRPSHFFFAPPRSSRLFPFFETHISNLHSGDPAYFVVPLPQENPTYIPVSRHQFFVLFRQQSPPFLSSSLSKFCRVLPFLDICGASFSLSESLILLME